jgi:hypothetical protein
MSVYTLIALIDVPLVVLGYLFVRRFHESRQGLVLVLTAIIGPLAYLGIAYFVLWAAMILPGCPGNRWAC